MNRISKLILLFGAAYCNNDEDTQEKEQEATKYLSLSIIIILCIMLLNNFLEGQLKKFKLSYPSYGQYIQSAELSTFLGIIVGLLIMLVGVKEVSLTMKRAFEQIFMIILLPPILFESAINMNKAAFFRNIGSISLLAIFGTLTSIVVTGVLMYSIGIIGLANKIKLYDAFVFGSMISATDPVSVLSSFKEINADERLFALVFGESILNDAVTLTLYRTLLGFSQLASISVYHVSVSFTILIFGSCTLGILFGLIGSFILKKVNIGSSTAANHQITIMIVLPWVSFLTADSFGLSGIVTIMFCGFSMSHYSLPNLSKQAKRNTKDIYETAAKNFEALAFIFIGISVFAFEHNLEEIGLGLFVFTFLIILFARYCNIYLIGLLLQKFPSARINPTHKFVLWFSGLRGAMAFAIAIETSFKFPTNNVGQHFLTMTIVYTCMTIFGCGSSLQAVIEKFNVKADPDAPQRSLDRRNIADFIKLKFVEFDNKILFKTFTRDIPEIEPEGTRRLSRKKLATRKKGGSDSQELSYSIPTEGDEEKCNSPFNHEMDGHITL